MLLFAYGYVHQNTSEENQVSRLDVLYSLFLHGTLSIDAYHTNTPCKTYYQGHFFSDKPPGMIILAVPAFAAALGFLAAIGVSPDSPSATLFLSWITTFATAGMITALGGVALFDWIFRWIRPKCAFIVTIGIALGSAMFPYATMLLSHSVVIALITFALRACSMYDEIVIKGRFADSRCVFLIGFCCGLAVTCEYSAGLVAGSIMLCLIARSRNRCSTFLKSVLGAAAPLVFIPAYNWMCFGSVFTLAYTHDFGFPEMQRGFCGIGLPRMQVAVELLFGATRGLFFWSPILLMAPIGYIVLLDRSRWLFWLCYIVPIAQLITISGFGDWRAGTTLTPRYLAPCIPLFALPVALGIERCSRCGTLLALLSMLVTGLGTLINATPSIRIVNPLLEVHLPALLKGSVANNISTIGGFSGHVSILLFWGIVALCSFLLIRNLPTPLVHVMSISQAKNLRPGDQLT